MARPAITEDQWELAVTMLANALRKDAHLRDRARVHTDRGDPLRDSIVRLRSLPSQRCIDGMHDMLRLLFVDGDVLADACLEEAARRAMGIGPSAPPPQDGTPIQ